MKKVGKGQAGGKLILAGEHAVVYGEPALGLGVSKNVRVQIQPGMGKLNIDAGPWSDFNPPIDPQKLIRLALGRNTDGFDVRISTDFPPMSGFGSSAAFALALLRAKDDLFEQKAPSRPKLYQTLLRFESIAHHKPSGVDPALCLAQSPILFRRTSASEYRMQALAIAKPSWLVVGSLGFHGGTKFSIEKIAAFKSKHRSAFRLATKSIGECAKTIQRALRVGDLAGFGQAADLNHGILAGLGLVSDGVERIVRYARHEGALGAKMSGAGGAGGAFYAIFEKASEAKRFQKLIEAQCDAAWIEKLSG